MATWCGKNIDRTRKPGPTVLARPAASGRGGGPYGQPGSRARDRGRAGPASGARLAGGGYDNGGGSSATEASARLLSTAVSNATPGETKPPETSPASSRS